jgi:homocitrate synthase NifV
MEDDSSRSVYDYDDLIEETDPDYEEGPYFIDVTLPLFFPYSPEKVGKVSNEWRELLTELGVGRVKMPPSQIKPTDSLIGLDGAFLTDYKKLFEDLKALRLSEVAFGDRMGCSTALAAAWLEEGGVGVIASARGVGGFPVLEELRLMMHVTGRLPMPANSRQLMRRYREMVEHISEEKTPHLEPVLGKAIFAVESGIHVDGILKDPSLYEPFPPSLVSGRRFLGLGVHTGSAALKLKCAKLGVDPLPDILEALLDGVKEKALELERGITDEELIFMLRKLERQMR